jgi:hypothetical protein
MIIGRQSWMASSIEFGVSYAGAGLSCGGSGEGRTFLAAAGVGFSGFVSILGVRRSSRAWPAISI